MVSVVFPATVEALGLTLTFGPPMTVTIWLPSATTAKMEISPETGDEKRETISAALGVVRVRSEAPVSKRNRRY